jgi:hypothetical protein
LHFRFFHGSSGLFFGVIQIQFRVLRAGLALIGFAKLSAFVQGRETGGAR